MLVDAQPTLRSCVMDSQGKPPSSGDEDPAFVVDEDLTLEQWIKEKQAYKDQDRLALERGEITAEQLREQRRYWRTLAHAEVDAARWKSLK